MSSCELNWGQSFFILLSLVPTSLVLAVWCVARCVWKPMVDRGKKICLPPLPYEFKYPFLADTPVTDSSGVVLEGTLVVDETPQGLVILTYDPKQNEFNYWSDNNIQYRFLEALARKYVQSFRCEHFFIDRIEELRKEYKIQHDARKNVKQATSKKSQENDIFATLKVAGVDSVKNQRNMIVAKKSNRYIKRGRFEECPQFKYAKPNKSKKLGYNDFKLFFEKQD